MDNILQAASQYLGTQDFNNFCQAFVEKVTQGKTGIYPSAIQAWQSQQNNAVQGTQGLQPGDTVYFSPNASNNGYGHTGVYQGNGKFISATSNGVREYDLNQWQQMTGQQLLGYVPQKGGNNHVQKAVQHGQNVNGLLASRPAPQQITMPRVQMNPATFQAPTGQTQHPTLPSAVPQQGQSQGHSFGPISIQS